MTRILMLVLGMAGLGLVSACNTIGGAGQDIQEGGEFIQQSAQEVEAELEE